MALRQAQRKPKLLLIDGNNLFHRAYHALPPLTDKSGENANAVYGFSNMLFKAVSETKPDYVACAFDTAAPTFRHIEFAKYKAQRPAPPADLYPQLPKVKKVLEAFGVPYFEKAGFEADDVLASIASKFAGPVESLPPASARKNTRSLNKDRTDGLRAVGSPSSLATRKFDIVILSGDRDCLQLVDGAIKIQMPSFTKVSEGKPGWGVLMGAKEVLEKYGVTPAQMVDYKSMVGDASDNVPGIAGIGPKTAAQLLQKYKTLEAIYKHLDETGETTRAKLKAGKDVALAAKKLVALDTKIDLPFTIDDLRYAPDWEKVRKEFEGLGFKSIVAKLSGGEVSEVPKSKGTKSGDDNQLKLM